MTSTKQITLPGFPSRNQAYRAPGWEQLQNRMANAYEDDEGIFSSSNKEVMERWWEECQRRQLGNELRAMIGSKRNQHGPLQALSVAKSKGRIIAFAAQSERGLVVAYVSKGRRNCRIGSKMVRSLPQTSRFDRCYCIHSPSFYERFGIRFGAAGRNREVELDR